jgi:hypothetical protein
MTAARGGLTGRAGCEEGPAGAGVGVVVCDVTWLWVDDDVP